MTERREPTMTAGRRGVLLGAGALGVGAVLTACGGSTESPGDRSAESPGESSTGQPSSDAATAGVEVKVADVPVGGGVVLKEEQVVVTQPQAGQFHAFSAVCTHKQCTVATVADHEIACPCHGSRFSATDGAVVHGPATQPLPAKAVTVNGDVLTVT